MNKFEQVSSDGHHMSPAWGCGGLMCGLARDRARARGGPMSDTGGGRSREACAVRSNAS